MNAYRPQELEVVGALIGILAAITAFGTLCNRKGNTSIWRPVAWIVVAAAFAAAERLCRDEPAGFRMLAILATVLYGMKAVVSVESRIAGAPPLTFGSWLAFCLFWFGMRPAAFSSLGRSPRVGYGRLLKSGTSLLVIGISVLVVGRLIFEDSAADAAWSARTLFSLLALMVGLSLIVHFGLFDLLAGCWRYFGADCRKLFRAPALSRSLSEFWSRRWNVAFSEMAAIAIYRPLKPRWGSSAARTAAFLFSGLLHEIAISVPVQAGFGLPFCCFLLHALAMRIESTAVLKRCMRSQWFARSWTTAWILLPLPMLFHRPFCEKILLPLL